MNPSGFPVPAEAGPITPAAGEPLLTVAADPGFTAWLARENVSFAASTYQTSRLLLIGRRANGRPAVFERLFERAMGLFVDAPRRNLWLSCQTQLWRFADVLETGALQDDSDCLYVPRQSWVTGDLDIHDLVVDGEGWPWFIATGLNCLATVDERYNVRPVWKPPFISALAAEDRCHLNGLALHEGRPRFVTVVGRSDVADGWREHRVGGGMVLDMDDGSEVVGGLSMPHSPRWHQGRLWLLNSGAGELGYVAEGGRFQPVAFCPGYARGLAFHGDYAVVGLSKPRHESFGGLPLDGRLADMRQQAMCGVVVIDLRDGAIVHWLRLEGIIVELFDVQIIPGVARPTALGFRDDSLGRTIFLDPAA